MRSAAFAFDILILDDGWRPRARLAGAGEWTMVAKELMRLDGRWIAIEQRRADDAPVHPDRRDIALTRALRRQLKAMEMEMADHVIRAGNARFSFRAAGLL